MRPIKILHLIPTLSSGGAERQLANLIGNTSKEEINHVVCVIGNADFFAPYIREAGYTVIGLEEFSKHPFLKATLKFRKIINREKPDIIHSWLYDANVIARLSSLLGKKIPLITSLQLPDYEPEAIRSANWNPYKVVGLKLIDKVTALITKPDFVSCSNFVKDSYQTYFGIGKNKSHVIYNSVEPKLLISNNSSRTLRQELNLPKDAFVYINVGRLDPQKNHRNLLVAFKQLSGEIPNICLLLVGVGGLESELEELAEKLEISDKVYFLGRRNDVNTLLEMSDVFVFPSYFEGLPVALIEAMFKSLPCIASRIKVFEEVIENNRSGLLIDPDSPTELKDAMLELYKSEKLRKKLGENAFKRITETFTIAVTGKQWKELYKEINRSSISTSLDF